MPDRATPSAGVVRFMLSLRADAVAHFLDEARRTRSRHAFSALEYHATDLRRYAAVSLQNARDRVRQA